MTVLKFLLGVHSSSAMRHVAHSLLVGVEAKQNSPQPLSVSAAQQQEGQWCDGGAVQLAAGVYGCVITVV